MSEGFDLEKTVADIVIDAVAATIGEEHSRVDTTMPLADIESLDRQEIFMEIEEGCDSIPEIDKRNISVQLPDAIQDTKTIADLIATTLSTVETLLHETSGNAQA